MKTPLRWPEFFPFRYVLFISLPVTWLAATLLLRVHQDYATLLPRSLICILPIPLVFLLLVRLLERERSFIPVPSFMAALSVAAFVWATRAVPGRKLGYDPALLCLATAMGCLAFMPWREWWQRVKENPHPCALAVFAAACPLMFFKLSDLIWEHMSAITATIIHFLLSIYEADVNLEIAKESIVLASPHYRLSIYQACSGLEGIFIFAFLLSLLLLVDWKLFEKHRMWALYVAGAAYMFVFNVMRLLFLYLLANWAWSPLASEFAMYMRGWPLELFHSLIGLTLYLIAFGIFAGLLYQSAIRRAKKTP